MIITIPESAVKPMGTELIQIYYMKSLELSIHYANIDLGYLGNYNWITTEKVPE